jgi:NitT/TauT family transport system ATP-binding protein
MAEPIAIRGVSKNFQTGKTSLMALKDIELDVEAGEFVAIVGASGCGKSTLLRLIGGLLAPSQGEIRIGDKAVTEPNPGIGIVFQTPVLLPWRTVQENVRLPLDIQRTARDPERIGKLLELVGLRGFESSSPFELSGGMQQRVALCRALVTDPSLLLMDEPFGALDEQTRMVLGEDLSVLLSRTDKTIVFVTHSLGEAVFLADRVAVFSARPGTIKEIIEVDEPHPRKPDFITSEKFTRIRNQLYSLLHDEIRKAVSESAVSRRAAADAASREPKP